MALQFAQVRGVHVMFGSRLGDTRNPNPASPDAHRPLSEQEISSSTDALAQRRPYPQFVVEATIWRGIIGRVAV